VEGKTHRLFVALEPPDAVRRRIAARATALRQAAGRHAEDVRWVPVENLHLTVQFLGAVPEQRVESVADAVRAAAAASRPLALEVKGAGGFPNARRPRVIWLGLEGDVESARALVADVGRRLAPLGFAPEARPWSAHLTLGRARDPRGAPGLGGALVARAQEDGIPWRAGELVLIESHLSPKGPRYEPIVQAALGA
jgi:2'-5' RNA ligase